MSFFKLLLSHLPLLSSYIDCKHNGGYHQMRIGEYLKFKIGINRIYWPKERTCIVANPRKIYVGKCCNIGRPGTYIQGAGKIYIGNYVGFGPNVGILSAYLDLYDHRKANTKPIRLGDYCWIGMGSIVLPGVDLGPRTIVAANSTVTKSFPKGYCVIGGCPAKVIKELDPEKVVKYSAKREYFGFIPADKFDTLNHLYIEPFIKQDVEEYFKNHITPPNSGVCRLQRKYNQPSFFLAVHSVPYEKRQKNLLACA